MAEPGIIVVKDSYGNIRKFDPSFDISQYITKEEVNQIINELPVSVSEIDGTVYEQGSVLTLLVNKTDNSSEEVEIDLSDLLPTAVISKIVEYNSSNVTSIVPSIDYNTTEELVLKLEITTNDNTVTTVSTPLQTVINETISQIPEYIPPTEEIESVSGLVPAITLEQVNDIFTGSGWKSIDELGISNDLSKSNLECDYVTVKKELHFGLFLFNENYEIIDTLEIITNLHSTEVWTEDYIVTSINGIQGCGYSQPYNTVYPTSLEQRTYDFFQDKECWKNDNVDNHYVVTFSNGFTVDTYIAEVSGNDYTIRVTAYGPKAKSPKMFFLDVNGNKALYYLEMDDTENKFYEITDSNVSLYPRTSVNTQVYLNEDISGLSLIQLSTTPYTNDYLPLTFVRIDGGIAVSGKEIDVSDWDKELSNVQLNLVQSNPEIEDIINEIDMNCLVDYISTELAKVDGKISDEEQARILADQAIMNVIGAGVVHITGDETIDGVKTFVKNYFSTPSELTGNSIDVSKSSVFTKTITENTTFTFTGVPSGKASVFTLVLENGGSKNVEFPNNVVWDRDKQPKLNEEGIDILTFFTSDGGTTWYCNEKVIEMTDIAFQSGIEEIEIETESTNFIGGITPLNKELV